LNPSQIDRLLSSIPEKTEERHRKRVLGYATTARRIHARLDAFERLELLGQLERAVGGLLAAALDDGIVDRAQGTLELSAQSADAGVDAARGGGVAEYALAVALLRGVRDRSEQAVDLGRVHDRRALR